MRDLLITIAVIAIAYLAWFAWMCRNAPEGFEADDGWKPGRPEDYE